MYDASAERKHGVGQRLLSKVIEHIALVLFGIEGFIQVPAFFVVYYARVMPGNDRLATELPGVFLEQFEFHVPVARDTGIRRQPAGIALRERDYDLLPELLRKIAYMMCYPEMQRYTVGILNIRQ